MNAPPLLGSLCHVATVCQGGASVGRSRSPDRVRVEPDRVEEQTHEHQGALDLLRNLVLKGRVVLGDALFCQREICQQVLDSRGDDLMAAKGKQPT